MPENDENVVVDPSLREGGDPDEVTQKVPRPKGLADDEEKWTWPMYALVGICLLVIAAAVTVTALLIVPSCQGAAPAVTNDINRAPRKSPPPQKGQTTTRPAKMVKAPVRTPAPQPNPPVTPPVTNTENVIIALDPIQRIQIAASKCTTRVKLVARADGTGRWQEVIDCPQSALEVTRQ